MQLTLQYPAWYFLLCLLTGAVAAFWLYYHDRHFKELGAAFTKWMWLLAAIRFLSVSFLAFLLLSPLIRTTVNRTEKPIVVLLQDNSQSVRMKGADSASYMTQWAAMKQALQQNYEVKDYTFGSALNESDKINFTDKTTDISSALQQVAGIYTNQNLGAVILATDGIYNEGSNPAYLVDLLHAPVYTIGLGDTTIRRDLLITHAYYNRTVFVGDFFPLKLEWKAQFCPNEKTTMNLSEVTASGEKLLDTKPVFISGNDDAGSTAFTLHETTAGLKHYRITLTPVHDEAGTANNVQDVFVEVQERKEKVLIIADAPHPDIAALRQTIEETRNYKVDVSIKGDFAYRLKDYSLFILDQVPSAASNTQALIEQIHTLKKSILYILGAQSNTGAFNSAQQLLTITRNNGTTTDALPNYNPAFTLFNLPEVVKQDISAFPPLQSPFGDYKQAPGAVALFTQKIGNVSTQYPLILFQQDMNGRTGIIAGEGLWRWRMWDYLQHKNQDAFNALISATVQYLAIQPDEQQFRVWLEKELQEGGNRIFSENESVVFDAELLNESNERINDPDVSMTIKDDSSKEYPFIFSKSAYGYTLNAGFFPKGSYSWQALVRYNNKQLTAAGTFSVIPTQLEFVNTRANHQVLYSLSEKTGGKLFYPSQLNDLAKAIEARQDIKPVLYSTARTEPLINLYWLLIPILLLLATEWGLRKYHGGY